MHLINIHRPTQKNSLLASFVDIIQHQPRACKTSPLFYYESNQYGLVVPLTVPINSVLHVSTRPSCYQQHCIHAKHWKSTDNARKSFTHVAAVAKRDYHDTTLLPITVASEAICKWGAQCRREAPAENFWMCPLTFLLCPPHMRGHNDCLLPTERQVKWWSRERGNKSNGA